MLLVAVVVAAVGVISCSRIAAYRRKHRGGRKKETQRREKEGNSEKKTVRVLRPIGVVVCGE